MAVPASVVVSAEPGTFTLIDVRKNADERQIPGSVRYNGEQIERAERLPFNRAQRVVLYCGSGNSSTRIAQSLRQKGYDADALEGGYAAWKDAGLPTEDLSAVRGLE